jgi:hypothetical protein
MLDAVFWWARKLLRNHRRPVLIRREAGRDREAERDAASAAEG